jgi:methionyl-tRNA formyltransferase
MARQGEVRAGVTLHFLDEGLDTGDIVAQADWPWPDGISGGALEEQCAGRGADLLLEAVQQLAEGKAVPRLPQSEAGTYFPWPQEDDCLIPTSWPARQAFNFMRIAEGRPLAIEIEGRQFSVRIANGYDPTAELGQPYAFQNDQLWVQFQPGVLKISL